MEGGSVALMQALSFTLGCIVIHHLRRHAELITELLTAAMLSLTILILVGFAAQHAPSLPPEERPPPVAELFAILP